MGRILYSILWFLPISAITYVLLMWTLNRIEISGTPAVYRIVDAISWKGGHTYKSFEEYAESKNQDMVVIGSSHAYHGYDPSVFEQEGVSLYNLGSSGQSITDTEILIKSVVRARESKLLLLDLYPGVFNGDGIESSSQLIANIGSDKAAREMAWALGDIRALNMLCNRMLNKNRQPIFEMTASFYKGFTTTSDSLTQTIDYDALGKSFSSNEKDDRALKGIIDYCEDEGIQLVLVSHPQPQEIHHEQQENFRFYIHQFLKGTEVEYLDFSFDHNLSSKDHFYDHTHLNQAGAELFSAILISELKVKGLWTE